MYPIKLKIGILDHMNNTFRNTVVQMSIDVPFNPFLGKIGPKKSKLFVLPENWHIEYLKDVDPYSDISFLSFQPYIHCWANLG